MIRPCVLLCDRHVFNQNQWFVVNRSLPSSVSCLQQLELDCESNPHWHFVMGRAEGVAYMCRDMRDGKLPIFRWLWFFLKFVNKQKQNSKTWEKHCSGDVSSCPCLWPGGGLWECLHLTARGTSVPPSPAPRSVPPDKSKFRKLSPLNYILVTHHRPRP